MSAVFKNKFYNGAKTENFKLTFGPDKPVWVQNIQSHRFIGGRV